MAFAILDNSEPSKFQSDGLIKMEVKQFVMKFDGTTNIAIREDVIIQSFPCSQEDIDQFYTL